MPRTKLHSLLREPESLWGAEQEARNKRYAMCFYASEVIEGQDDAIKLLEDQRFELQKLLAFYACQTEAGANDPRVIEALGFGNDEDYED